MNKLAVISLSGGIDSTSLLLHLISKEFIVYAVSFDYGQKHKIEIDRAKKNINYLKENGYSINHNTVDISSCNKLLTSTLTSNKTEVPEGFYEEKNMLSTVVPNRNAIFSSILYGYSLSISNETSNNVSLSLGVHSGDHAIYPDCRKEFYEKITDAFKTGNWGSENISLYLPYINYDKAQILKDAEESIKILNLNFEIIFSNTITSYSPDNNGISNGRTGSDIERILAFDEIGKKDPIKYKSSWENVVQHAKKVESNFKNK